MIDFTAFIDSLDIMWKGILGIFIVTAAIVILTVILNACQKKKKNGSSAEKQHE